MSRLRQTLRWVVDRLEPSDLIPLLLLAIIFGAFWAPLATGLFCAVWLYTLLVLTVAKRLERQRRTTTTVVVSLRGEQLPDLQRARDLARDLRASDHSRGEGLPRQRDGRDS